MVLWALKWALKTWIFRDMLKVKSKNSSINHVWHPTCYRSRARYDKKFKALHWVVSKSLIRVLVLPGREMQLSTRKIPLHLGQRLALFLYHTALSFSWLLSLSLTNSAKILLILEILLKSARLAKFCRGSFHKILPAKAKPTLSRLCLSEMSMT